MISRSLTSRRHGPRPATAARAGGIRATLLTSLAALALVAGCGDDTSEGTGGSSSSSTSTSTSSSTTATTSSGQGGSGGGDQGGGGAGGDGSGGGGGGDDAFCAEQHLVDVDGLEVVVCDALFDDVPGIHLPEPRPLGGGLTEVFATLGADTLFVATDGTVHDPGDTLPDPAVEAERHAFAFYRLEVDADGVAVVAEPRVIVDERLILAPLVGATAEGLISIRTGDGEFSMEPSLPIRITFTSLAPPDGEIREDGMTRHALVVQVDNLDAEVAAADGTCLPALHGHGDEDPFLGATTVELRAERAPAMHGWGDDHFTFTYLVDGGFAGSTMGAAWYFGPEVLLGGLALPTLEAVAHGTPTSMPWMTLDLAEGGGGDCP